MRRRFLFVATMIALTYADIGAGNALLEMTPVSIQRRYVNGDEVTLSCPMPQNSQCVLTVVLDKKTKNIPIDFQVAGLEPNLNSIALFVSSPEYFGFAVQTGVGCRAEDEKNLDEQRAESAYCTVDFDYNQGQITWSSVHVEPVSDVNIYTDVTVPAPHR